MLKSILSMAESSLWMKPISSPRMVGETEGNTVSSGFFRKKLEENIAALNIRPGVKGFIISATLILAADWSISWLYWTILGV